ncbi:unnamed protein product [Ixodes hexagonus]
MSTLEGVRESAPYRTPHETLYGYCWCRAPAVAPVPTLKSVCYEVLVRDARSLCRLLPSVPDCFAAPLLARAVEDGRDRAAQLLVSVWPDDSLDLQSVLETNCPLGQHPCRLAAVAAIVRSFVEMSLSAEVSSRLHRLDVTGFQCGRELIEFIARKMTVYSKRRPLDRGGRSLRCDFLVGEAHTFDAFCAVLRHDRRALRVDVANLEVEGIGELRLSELLDTLEAEPVVGLSVAYNSLQNQGLLHVCERLRRFRGLVALDVSSNGVRRGDVHHYDSLADTLRALPRLRRLSLKSCRIGGYLNTLVSRCYRQIDHLDVSACGLRRQDLRVLEHFEDLQSLVLSDNNLSSLIHELAAVLLALGRLRVLLLSNCDLRSEGFDVVWDALKSSGNELRWLDLTWNRLSEEKLTEVVADLVTGGCLPRLVNLLVPVPSNPSPRYFEAVKRVEEASPRLRVHTDLV